MSLGSRMTDCNSPWRKDKDHGADGQILEYASGYLFIVGGTMMFQALMNACAVINKIKKGATRKQCKYAHTCSKRLLVPIPQTPEIVNEVDGCAFKER